MPLPEVISTTTLTAARQCHGRAAVEGSSEAQAHHADHDERHEPLSETLLLVVTGRNRLRATENSNRENQRDCSNDPDTDNKHAFDFLFVHPAISWPAPAHMIMPLSVRRDVCHSFSDLDRRSAEVHLAHANHVLLLVLTTTLFGLIAVTPRLAQEVLD